MSRLWVLLEVFKHLLFLTRVTLSFGKNSAVLFFFGDLQIIEAADFRQSHAKANTAARQGIRFGFIVIRHAIIARMIMIAFFMLMRVHGVTNGTVFLRNQCWRHVKFTHFIIKRIQHRRFDFRADSSVMLTADLLTHSGFQRIEIIHAQRRGKFIIDLHFTRFMQFMNGDFKDALFAREMSGGVFIREFHRHIDGGAWLGADQAVFKAGNKGV